MQEAIGHVRFSLTSSLWPWNGDPAQFWIEVTGQIMAMPDEVAAGTEPAGEIRMPIGWVITRAACKCARRRRRRAREMTAT